MSIISNSVLGRILDASRSLFIVLLTVGALVVLLGDTLIAESRPGRAYSLSMQSSCFTQQNGRYVGIVTNVECLTREEVTSMQNGSPSPEALEKVRQASLAYEARVVAYQKWMAHESTQWQDPMELVKRRVRAVADKLGGLLSAFERATGEGSETPD